jgi:cob(I)alamin adenosyltransferase
MSIATTRGDQGQTGLAGGIRVQKDAVRVEAYGNPNILAYVNRLSDLLWLLGRCLELKDGRDATLRDPDTPGNRWSRAW